VLIHNQLISIRNLVTYLPVISVRYKISV
jgi:hypothetical protein